MGDDEEAESPPVGELGILLAQVAVAFTTRFSELPRDSRIIHYCSGACVLVALVLATWRRAKRAPRAFRFFALALPLGIAGDSFVVVRMISGTTPFAVLTSILVIAISLVLWLISPTSKR